MLHLLETILRFVVVVARFLLYTFLLENSLLLWRIEVLYLFVIEFQLHKE